MCSVHPNLACIKLKFLESMHKLAKHYTGINDIHYTLFIYIIYEHMNYKQKYSTIINSQILFYPFINLFFQEMVN